MAKKKDQGGKPDRKNFHRESSNEVVVAAVPKNGKVCPKKRKGCTFLGRKDSCSINGSRCDC